MRARERLLNEGVDISDSEPGRANRGEIISESGAWVACEEPERFPDGLIAFHDRECLGCSIVAQSILVFADRDAQPLLVEAIEAILTVVQVRNES